MLRKPLILLIAIMVAACGGNPAPTPAPSAVAVMPTNTPRPLPQTRNAPTLPPTFTPTITPTITPTPTETLAPSPTATLTVDDICATLRFPTDTLNGVTIQEGTARVIAIGGGVRGGVIEFITTDLATGDETGGLLPGGTMSIINYGATLAPGAYEWRTSFTLETYVNVCQTQGNFTVIARQPESTPSQNPILVDVILLIYNRLYPQSPAATPTPIPVTPTPEA